MAEKIKVTSYSGHKLKETPRIIELRGRKYSVVKVEKRWQEQNITSKERKKISRIKTDSGKVYDISYNEASPKWLLEKEIKKG